MDEENGYPRILVDETALIRIAFLSLNCEAKLLQLPLLDRLSFLFLILHEQAEHRKFNTPSSLCMTCRHTFSA